MSPGSSEPTPLVIYGAGGHGQVVAEAARLAGMYVLGFVDDVAQQPAGLRLPVLKPDDPQLEKAALIVAVGQNDARRQLMIKLHGQGRPLVSVVHPTAIVSSSVEVGPGSYVGAGAIINPHTAIGTGCIINSGAIVEHHCRIGEFTHVAPGVTLGGNVTVGEACLVGLGATVLPGKRIGNGATVGAGAVVTHRVAEGATVTGVPATAVGHEI